ncbi:ABC transporter substrate-binding protein [Thiomicrorhabdus indica]|uniref:ABC transporter substrate-binding protein n=1 Tax=Thiomicrorhabdus indica TaxID=2267253 RepID=UPI00102DF5A3|nr:ABC transporter substrate-binding protein [Thiomicrorhabdus indica]
MRVSKAIAVLSIALVSSVTLLCGCSKNEPLKLSTHTWIGYETIPLAQQLGFIDDEINIFITQSASDSLERLETGLVDAATLTLDEVIQARSRGVDLTVVLVMDQSAGADSVYARHSIETLSSLKGKRIAYEEGAVGEIVLLSLLKQAGLQLDDVSLVNFPINRMEGVWRNDLADVVISYEPTSSAIEKHGGVRIFDSRQIPNMIVDVLAVRTELLKSREKAVRTLLDAHFTTLKFMEKNHSKAMEIISKRTGLSVAELQKALGGIFIPNLYENFELLKSGSDLEQTSVALQAMLFERKMMKKTSSLEGLLTNQYLPIEVRVK